MPGLKTEICERLGIEYPVFQAGMAFVARSALAGAVSEAGGLGGIGAGSNRTREEIKAEIDAVRAITDKPFGVDILFATVRAEARLPCPSALDSLASQNASVDATPPRVVSVRAASSSSSTKLIFRWAPSAARGRAAGARETDGAPRVHARERRRRGRGRAELHRVFSF